MGNRSSAWSVFKVPPIEPMLTCRAAVLGEIESSLYRNKTQKDIEVCLKPLFEKHMPLNSNTAHAARGAQLDYERKKDHYSHFILRLAFCRSYVLPLQTVLTQLGRIYVADLSEQKQCYFGLFPTFWDSLLICRIRYAQDDTHERQQFIESLNVDWQMVCPFHHDGF